MIRKLTNRLCEGIGLAGAISEVEKAGYKFENIVGASAGAIVAALLAVGYISEEIKKELENLDYNKFKDVSRLGKLIIILFNYGIYKGDILALTPINLVLLEQYE